MSIIETALALAEKLQARLKVEQDDTAWNTIAELEPASLARDIDRARSDYLEGCTLQGGASADCAPHLADAPYYSQRDENDAEDAAEDFAREWMESVPVEFI